MRIEDSNMIEKDYPQIDVDSFSAVSAEKCPKGIKKCICVNLRESAVKFLNSSQ